MTWTIYGTYVGAGGGGGGAVTSVAGRAGDVVLAAADVTGVEQTANKGAASGYAGLDAGSLVPAANSRVQSVAGRTGVITLAAADVTGVEQTANKNAASGYAGLDAGSLLTGTQVPYGSSANTACQGNDARLSNSRAPNGSAGGDLTGTYPNPTIATTSSPQHAGVGIATAAVANSLAIASAAAPSAPSGNILQLHNTVIANRQTLHVQDANFDRPYIPRFGRVQRGLRPIISNGASVTGEGVGEGISTAGTITHPALADTDYGTRQVRMRATSATTANSFGAFFTPTANPSVSRNAGYLVRIRFRFNNAAQANNNALVGFHTGSETLNDPTTHTNAIGIGWVNGDVAGNLFMITTDGTPTLTKTDLGSSAPRDAATVYEMTLHCRPADTVVGFRLVNLTTGAVVIDTTISTNMPAAAQFVIIDNYVECGTSAVAAVIDIIQQDEVYS